ncbi:MAG: NAD(P)H-binding protein [Actinomycetota bacterium]
MNVTVFGAGGRTGRGVVAEALARGHQVTAVVRRPPDPPLGPGVGTVTGDARDAEAVARALEGAEAVLSVMGPVGNDPGTAYSDAVAVLVAAMESTGPSRLVITANARVFDDRPLSGPFAGVSEEHRRALVTLRASGLEWTVVATPMLTDEETGDSYTLTVDGKGEGREIDRRNFARAVVDALGHAAWIGRAVDVTD